METIVRSKGGTAERTVAVTDIQVPDLWHIAMSINNKEARARVLDCWYLAHDLLRAVRDTE